MTTQGRVALFIYLAFFLLHVSVVSQRALSWPFPNQTDELEHLSFAYHLKENPDVVPDYGRIRVLAPPDWREWGERGNYINHPTPYYLAMGAFLPETRDDGTGWLDARFFNVGLSALALAAVFAFGRARLSSPRQHFLFAFLVAFCPMIGGMGGQINNDNLAILGGAVVLLGMGRLFAGNAGAATALVLGIGFVLGAWAKLTAGLLLGTWGLLAHLWLLAGRRPDWGRAYWPIALLAVVVGGSPYLHGLLVHGAPIWDNAHLFAREGARMTGYLDYLGWFFYGLGASWVVNQPGNPAQIVVLALFLVAAAWSAWAGVTGRLIADDAIPAVLGGLALGAVVLVLPIHGYYSHQVHVEVGHMGGPDFRYYLPLWAGVAAGAAAGLAPRDRGGVVRAALALVAFSLFFYAAVYAPSA